MSAAFYLLAIPYHIRRAVKTIETVLMKEKGGGDKERA